MYSASTTSCYYVFITNGFEVLILLYLYKGNYGAISFNNPSIKLEVVGGSETFTFLGYKLCLFQACLLFFSEIVISNKEGIVSL